MLSFLREHDSLRTYIPYSTNATSNPIDTRRFICLYALSFLPYTLVHHNLVAQGQFRGTAFKDESFVGLESVPGALKALGGRETWGKVVVNVVGNEKAKSRL